MSSPAKRPGWMRSVKTKPKGIAGGQRSSTEQRAMAIMARRPELPDRRVAKISGLALKRVKELRALHD